MSAATALMELVDVTKAFPLAGTAYPALRGIHLTIAAGEFVAITGPSGHGKSTLMSLLGGLDQVTSGTYRFSGVDVATLADDALARLRGRQVGFVFQSFNLIATLTSLENVELPMVYAKVPQATRTARAKALLSALGLEHHGSHRPAQLSGGQQQRVAIARALVLNPPLILADEPTGNLDSRASAEILDHLTALHAQGHTVVVVTHDPEVAARAHREVHILDGRVEWDRPAAGREPITGGGATDREEAPHA